MTFHHPWFPQGKFLSFWGYYNKINVEGENPNQESNVRRFFSRQVIPMIPLSQANKINIEKLNELVEELKVAIRSSKKRCCCCKCTELIFGRLD